MLTCVHVCSGSVTGTGFTTFHLPPPLNTVSLGICMDLNVQPPATWDFALGPYEVAEYCIAQKTNLLVLLNAWLDSKQYPEHSHDLSTIGFWSKRLRPLWTDDNISPSDEASDSDRDRTTLVAICNRGGTEKGKLPLGDSGSVVATNLLVAIRLCIIPI